MNEKLTAVPGIGIPDKLGAHFSYPNQVYDPVSGEYHSDGMVWLGVRPMVGRDVKALQDIMSKDIAIDPASEVGLLNKDWTCNFYSHASNQDKPNRAIPGGVHSALYKMEHVHMGVRFTEVPTWMETADGKLEKVRTLGTPFHSVDDGDGYQHFVEGPEPGTAAFVLIAWGGSFTWDDDALRWRMLDHKGKVIEYNRHQHAYDIAEKLGSPIID